MRHAFLIIAHDHPRELGMLLAALDDADNDIYVHIDAKATDLDEAALRRRVEASGLWFTERTDVTWGGSSQIRAEMLLFDTAYRHGGYRYYHMLSGVDQPVKGRRYIHEYFERHDGENFISLKDCDDDSPRFRMRYEQYHLLQDSLIGKKRNAWKYLEFAGCYAQRALGVRRFRGRPMKRHINWVSVTDDVVGLLVRRRDGILRDYRWTYCCDEVFLLSEIWDTPLRDTISRVGNLRHIEWEWRDRHDCSPKVLTMDDASALDDPDVLFARKIVLPDSQLLLDHLREGR